MSKPDRTTDEYYQLWFDDPNDVAAVARLHQLAKMGEDRVAELERLYTAQCRENIAMQGRIDRLQAVVDAAMDDNRCLWGCCCPMCVALASLGHHDKEHGNG